MGYVYVLRCVLLCCAVHVDVIYHSAHYCIFSFEIQHMTTLYFIAQQHRKIREISNNMHHSFTFDEWHKHALRYDEIKGNNIWREEKSCNFYNHKLLSMRIIDIQNLMAKDDMFTLMFRLRGTLKR